MNRAEKGYYKTTALKDGKHLSYKTRKLTALHKEMHKKCTWAETLKYDPVEKKWDVIRLTGEKEKDTFVSV